MTNPLLQSQLDRFDEKFGPIWTLWNTVVAKFAGAEKVIDTSPELAIKAFLQDCDKERLMWVVEKIDMLMQKVPQGYSAQPVRAPSHAVTWNTALKELSSLIKKEIGVTE